MKGPHQDWFLGFESMEILHISPSCKYSTVPRDEYDPHMNYKSGLRGKIMPHYKFEKVGIFRISERHQSMIMSFGMLFSWCLFHSICIIRFSISSWYVDEDCYILGRVITTDDRILLNRYNEGSNWSSLLRCFQHRNTVTYVLFVSSYRIQESTRGMIGYILKDCRDKYRLILWYSFLSH